MNQPSSTKEHNYFLFIESLDWVVLECCSYSNIQTSITGDGTRTPEGLLQGYQLSVCHCFGLILGMDNKNSLTTLNVVKTLTRCFNSLINGLILHWKCTGMKSFCKATQYFALGMNLCIVSYYCCPLYTFYPLYSV